MSMDQFDWDQDKNRQLKVERNISFEELVYAILTDHVLDLIPNPNQKRYPGELMYIVEINEYAYFVPFVEEDNIQFLKTIIPSRKATRRYLR